MRRGAVLIATALLAVSCGSGSSSGSHNTPSAKASPAAAVSPSASPSAGPLTGTYGLILSAGDLNLIKPDASIAATVPVASASAQYCSSQHDALQAPPPVSASNDEVYFRDGDTKIRMLVPPGGAADVTTVPGGPNTISFFSVSPDDKSIAVLVEDVSGATAISLSLYVEDLHGGGHHTVIYTSTTPKGKNGTTLWPMGWHAGALVLAVVPACTFQPAGITPTEWHVASTANGTRLATIKANACTLSFWPSPAGVGCVGGGGATTLYDWTGKVLSATGPPTPSDAYQQSAVSPAGNSAFWASGAAVGTAPPATQILQLGPGPYASVQGHAACIWIDEDHLLAPDAVIQFPAETPGNLQVTAAVTALTASGVCAGRFPGGL
ncbi:MAG: hypothetical protein ABI334_02855 [Candidatus Dormiibacterota bacterium]